MKNCNTFSNSYLRLTKEKETYIVSSTVTINGTYKITKKDCNEEVLIEQGTFSNPSITFTLKTDGEYLLSILENSKEDSIIISHYPAIIKRIVNKMSYLLCNDCNKNYKQLKPCITQEEENFLLYGDIYSQLLYLTNIINPIKIGESCDIIKDFITTVIRENKCEFLFIFCKDELNYKIKGEHNNSFKNSNREILGILYLILYYYEKRVSINTIENNNFLNNKYNYYELKKCLIKIGLDLTKIELIFEELVLEDEDLDIICPINTINPVVVPTLKVFTFPINKNIDGVYDVVSLKNTGIDPVLFMSGVIYNNGKIKVSNDVVKNPIEVNANQVFNTTILFSGKYNSPQTFNIPYIIENTLINTYRLIFKDEQGNTSPIITSIIKLINNRERYYFSINDFESHFIDFDGDMLEEIELLGDVSQFKIENTPYILGTKINRLNISKLNYTPLNTDDNYDLVLEWKAWDSSGAVSN